MSIFALALAAGIAGQSADPANESDLKCVAAVAMVISAQGKDAAPGLAAGMMYFLGRIDARQPGYDLEANLRRITAGPDAGAELKSELVRCGAILEERGTYLTGIGGRMTGSAAH